MRSKIEEQIKQKKYYITFTHEIGKQSSISDEFAFFYSNAFRNIDVLDFDKRKKIIMNYVKQIITKIKKSKKNIVEININAENNLSSQNSTGGTCVTQNFLTILIDECKKNNIETFIINNLACFGMDIIKKETELKIQNETIRQMTNSTYTGFIKEYLKKDNNNQCVFYYGCVYFDDTDMEKPSIVKKIINENSKIKEYDYVLFNQQIYKKENGIVEYKDLTDFNSPNKKNIDNLNRDIYQNSKPDIKKYKKIQNQLQEYEEYKQNQKEKLLKKEQECFIDYDKITDKDRKTKKYKQKIRDFEAKKILNMMYDKHKNLYDKNNKKFEKPKKINIHNTEVLNNKNKHNNQL